MPRGWWRALRDERGESLVELIVAVAILGIAAVAILSGLMLSVKASDQHRKEATGGAYVRSFAEAIQDSVDAAGGYQSCASAASSYGAVAVPDLPASYTKSVTAVKSWSGSSWDACSAAGIQRVDLKVTSPGDASHRFEETLTVVLRRPCNGDAAPAGADPCA
jgi:prepilin-type N-terminal cleavage/methylation domain-containing protein